MKLLKPLAIFLSTAFLLAGCSPQAHTPHASSTEKVKPAVETSSDIGLGDLQIPKNIPDANKLKGVTEVKTLPPIQPITKNPSPKLPATIKDNKGKTVTVTDLSRIVTLDIYGTTSKTLVALGLGKNIVGRGVSDTDPEVKGAKIVTHNGIEVNTEAVIALNPSLVFADTTIGSADTIQKLRNIGITVIELNPNRSAALINPEIMAIADAVGLHQEGTKLTSRVAKQMNAVRNYIKAISAKTSKPIKMALLYVRGNAGIFFIFGKASAAAPLITDLKGDDVAGDRGLAELAPANAEALSKINPQLILAMTKGIESTGGIDGFLARPGVSETTAGQNQRIISVPDTQLLSFGIDYPACLKLIADAVYLGK